jgi:hypothetical protein
MRNLENERRRVEPSKKRRKKTIVRATKTANLAAALAHDRPEFHFNNWLTKIL